jgi:glycerol-3-phosphate acyltransferase PlsY
MRWHVAAASVILGYLLGSISFARLVTRWFAPAAELGDLTVPVVGTEATQEVGIFGANAASMVLGPRLGCAVAVLDMLKVALLVLALRWRFPAEPYFLIASLGGLVGHNWPIYYRFKGGRGFAVIFGSFLVVDWLGAVVTVLGGTLLGMVLLGNAFVAYIGWLWLMIPWMWLRRPDPVYLTYAIVVNLVFLIATLPEIRTFIAYRREGKLDAYMQGLRASSPRWRGMQRMAERLSIRRRA